MEMPSGSEAQGAQATASGAEWYGMMTAQVLAFFGRLRRIPIGAWCSLAESDPHTAVPRALEQPLAAVDLAREAQADCQARARLREVMETMPDAVRRIRSRIDGEIGIVDGIASPMMVRRIRRAARLAACALAARPWLSTEEFARLYRPFAELIPVAGPETQ